MKRQTPNSNSRSALSCSSAAVVIAFPPIERCPECSGSGLCWSIQRRTGLQQVASNCKRCGGSGRYRNTSHVRYIDP